MKHLSAIFTLVFLAWTQIGWAKVVRYELTIENKPVNITGKPVDFALMVNGGIPAPTLEFTEGDEAEITVKNGLKKEEVSIHWHGLLLPPSEDGVPYVNTPPIFPGQSYTFRFKIRQHGTYWYHSHTGLQEQKGVYGAFIIHPKKKTIQYDKDLVVILSDWSDENGDQILKNLKKDGDYYLYKKKSVRSIGGAIQAGALQSYLKNEWIRMGGMDLSDVGYDAFLINGKQNSQLLEAHPGDKIRVRIINAAASSYFYVSLGNLPMKVISADGMDIDPILTDEILMGMAETYDILFTPPEHKNYELRATVQDVTGFASGWIGMGSQVRAADKPAPNLYAEMDHGSGHGGGEHDGHSPHGDHDAMKAPHRQGVIMQSHGHHSMDHHKPDLQHQGQKQKHKPSQDQRHNHHSMVEPDQHGANSGDHVDKVTKEHSASRAALSTLTVDAIKAQVPTILPKTGKVHDLKFVLGGDMERYVWHINGKAIHEDRDIFVNEGDIVRFQFVNDTMMHHPMHLHGHFFRVLNQHGERSPLKHTVDVPPHGERTIEFYANERGQWMLHCHNLYHLKTGMARVVKYMSYQPSPEMQKWDKKDPHLHDHWYGKGHVKAASNHLEGEYSLSQTWNEFEARIEARQDEDWESEGDLFYRRWLGNFLSLNAGGSIVHGESRGQLGIGYILPMLIETQLLVDQHGQLRVDLEKRFQWTQNLFTDAEYIWRQEPDFDSEYSLSLMYASSWEWSFGLKYTGQTIGVGFQYQF